MPVQIRILLLSVMTNSFGGATTTRLFDIDSNLDILAQQNPANDGTLVTIGPLTWNTTANAGLDIIRRSNRGNCRLRIGGWRKSGRKFRFV